YPFAGDGFVAKLSIDGSALLSSTRLCGQGDDSPSGIAIDAAGNAYVAGTTASSDFPLVDPIELSRGGGVVGLSGCVSKLSPDGSQLLYSTYLGGSGSAVINGLALDADRNVYVTGETESVDFPTTPGVIQEHPGKRHCIEGCTDAFVSKIAPSGSALVYSTYLYGEVDDAGNAIAVDGSGNAYVMGITNSGLFPILHAFQHVDRGLADAFVVKLNPDATRLVHSSFLGGSRFGSSPAPGGTIVATWAGNPTPTASDYLRLFALGSAGEEFDDVVIGWSTPGAAAGQLSLLLPADLPVGSYELRLLSPPPGSSLPVPIARSEPIWITASTTTSTTTTTPQPTTTTTTTTASTTTTTTSTAHPTTTSTSTTTHAPTTTTLQSMALCEIVGASVCDDGDPCTVDSCVPRRGCVSTPASGFASVTC